MSRLGKALLLSLVLIVASGPANNPRPSSSSRLKPPVAGAVLAAPLPEKPTISRKSYWVKRVNFFDCSFPLCREILPIPFASPVKLKLSAIKARTGALHVDTSVFMDTASGHPIDTYIKGHQKLEGREIGFPYIYITKTRLWGITHNYQRLRDLPDVVFVYALGQLLYPRSPGDPDAPGCRPHLRLSRSALGIEARHVDSVTEYYIHSVRVRSATISELRRFMVKTLHCHYIVNRDAGSSFTRTRYAIAWCEKIPQTHLVYFSP